MPPACSGLQSRIYRPVFRLFEIDFFNLLPEVVSLLFLPIFSPCNPYKTQVLQELVSEHSLPLCINGGGLKVCVGVAGFYSLLI